jgi:hypothetical protein
VAASRCRSMQRVRGPKRGAVGRLDCAELAGQVALVFHHTFQQLASSSRSQVHRSSSRSYPWGWPAATVRGCPWKSAYERGGRHSVSLPLSEVPEASVL